MPLKETIVAQSTAYGQAAIAMIRASGPLCESLAQTIFSKDAPPPLIAKQTSATIKT